MDDKATPTKPTVDDSNDSTTSPSSWMDYETDLATKSLKAKHWGMSLKLDTGWDYNDNLGSSTSGSFQGANSYYVRPIVGITIGQELSSLFFRLNYSPEFRYYEDHVSGNAINHYLGTSFTIAGSRSRITGTINASKSDGSEIEGGSHTNSKNVSANISASSHTNSKNVSANISASYDISDKTKVGLELTPDLSSYQSLDSYQRYSGSTFADYALTAKTRLGFGLTYEHVAVDLGPNQDAYGANFRLGWNSSRKLSINGIVGPQWRYFDGVDGARFNYNLGLALDYKVTEKTRLTANIYRHTNPSVTNIGQSYDSTGVSLGITETLTSRLSATLSTGFEHSSYFSPLDSSDTTGDDRSDDYFFIRPKLTYTVSNYLSFTAYYQYSKNSSSGTNSESFARNQVGMYGTLSY
jgi:hypothetical protein